MTHDELVEAVARALCRSDIIGDEGYVNAEWVNWEANARAAIDVVVEECAKIPENNSRVCTYTMANVLLSQAAAIRALKQGDVK